MGHYVRKTKIVNGQTTYIDEYFTSLEDAKRFAKMLGASTTIYPAHDKGITNQYQNC